VKKNWLYIAVLFVSFLLAADASQAQKKQLTYCNPINIDYGYTPIPNFATAGKHRATADPVIVTYKGDYYLFSTNQWGYWYSSDMSNWTFVAAIFYAPSIRCMTTFARPLFGYRAIR
jgi:xylan 1,4-beta-xylosidase